MWAISSKTLSSSHAWLFAYYLEYTFFFNLIANYQKMGHELLLHKINCNVGKLQFNTSKQNSMMFSHWTDNHNILLCVIKFLLLGKNQMEFAMIEMDWSLVSGHTWQLYIDSSDCCAWYTKTHLTCAWYIHNCLFCIWHTKTISFIHCILSMPNSRSRYIQDHFTRIWYTQSHLCLAYPELPHQ